jgi:general secretion pathway protein I
MRATKRLAHGFTLIEVIVAMIVIGLGMLGVIQAVSQTASNSGYLRDKTIAHWVAMNRLTEIRLQKTAPGIDKTSDEVEMAGRRWKWTMNVTQTPVATIRRIDISVRPSEAKEGASLASVTGFYGTAVAPPGSALISWQGVGRHSAQGQGDRKRRAAAPPKSAAEEDRRPKSRRARLEPDSDPSIRSNERRAANMRTRGFTLLEVLVAVVIFGIISVLAYGGYQPAHQAERDRREQRDAHACDPVDRATHGRRLRDARAASRFASRSARRSNPRCAPAVRAPTRCSISRAPAGRIPLGCRARPCSESHIACWTTSWSALTGTRSIAR